jgi:hypothetical protein
VEASKRIKQKNWKKEMKVIKHSGSFTQSHLEDGILLPYSSVVASSVRLPLNNVKVVIGHIEIEGRDRSKLWSVEAALQSQQQIQNFNEKEVQLVTETFRKFFRSHAVKLFVSLGAPHPSILQ